MTRPVHLRLTSPAAKHVKRGHPWVFERSVTHQSHDGEAGDLVVLHDPKRRQIGLGLLDPVGPIRVRVLVTGPANVDAAFFGGRVIEAAKRREVLEDTTGYRVIHGEADGFGGLVVDRYADVLVVKVYSRAWLPHLWTIACALASHFSPRAIVGRFSRELQKLEETDEGACLFGRLETSRVTFVENGLHFSADVVRGQKTGFFLDQRDNRARVRERAKARRVLNVFSYSGGFSVYAAAGGAAEVCSLDLSAPALDDAAAHMARNCPGVAHRALVGDAFEIMADLAREKFDLVVIDPPAFAKQQSETARALAAYRKLTSLGLDVLAPGGELVLASCSSRVSAEAFVDNAEEAAHDRGVDLGVTLQTGHALDHPVTFPEGAYLKCIFCTPTAAF